MIIEAKTGSIYKKRGDRMRDRLWRIRRTPQKFHYLDWCEKIKEKYSSREEYGFAGATLTFLQGEKESEQKRAVKSAG